MTISKLLISTYTIEDGMVKVSLLTLLRYQPYTSSQLSFSYDTVWRLCRRLNETK